MIFDSFDDCQANDTLRISKKQWRQLFDHFDARSDTLYSHRQTELNNKRVAPRYAYEQIAGLIIQVVHPGGSSSYYLARPRNISSTGISFIHGTFLYHGTKTVIQLVTLDEQMFRVRGKVVRCHHVSGKVHEVGVRFDREIQPGAFTTVTDESNSKVIT